MPLSLENAETDMYADDTNIWDSGTNCAEIERTLNAELNKVGDWLLLNNMQLNMEKTKYMVIGAPQKLHHSLKNSMDLYLNGNLIKKSFLEY